MGLQKEIWRDVNGSDGAREMMMKILCYLIKALLETGLLTAILVIVSFISKAFHIDGFVALMIVVLVLQIFGFSEGDWQQ